MQLFSSLVSTITRLAIRRGLEFVFVSCLLSVVVMGQQPGLSDEELLTETQRKTFDYFWNGAELNSGWARERIHLDDPDLDSTLVTSGGTGFGLMAILVGIEREFVNREDAVQRLEKIIDFAERADRYHGVWPHWLLGDTGKVKPFSLDDDGADLVESSFLAQGLICVRQYFANGNPREQTLARRADQLWQTMEWDFFRGDSRENVLFWHWSPRVGWRMNFRIRGYNECLITYVLAASSPTHPIPAEVYHEGWAESGAIKETRTYLGETLTMRHQGVKNSCGPLFWSHYSFLGLDPRGLSDRYADYWAHGKSHVKMIHEHCVINPNGFKGYSADCWGLTASYSVNFYNAHAPENDNGTISPTAALSSFPYEPELCMRALRTFHDRLGERLIGKYGLYDAFNLEKDWAPPHYLAIDQGPIVIMMENHRTGLLWRLFMSAEEIQNGLKRLDFKRNTLPRE
ncbi:MAG: glucoamylase family protein [Pirellula sp.]